MDSTRNMGRWALVAGLAAWAWLVPSCQDPGREPAGVGTNPLSAATAPEAPAAASPAAQGKYGGVVEVGLPGRRIELPADPAGGGPMVLLTVSPDPTDLGCTCPAADCRCKPLDKGGFSCANAEGEHCACSCYGGPVLTPEEILSGGHGPAGAHGGQAVLVPGGVGEEGVSR